MVLSAQVKKKIRSITRKNAEVSGYDYSVAEYVEPNLDEQEIESEMPGQAESVQRWRQTDLEKIMRTFEGGQLTFIGPAGSGKTTLLKTIARLVLNKKFESMKNVEMVFFIDHSEIKNEKTTGRNLLFMSILSGEINTKAVESVFLYAERYPERILFVLDSIDTMKFEVAGVCDACFGDEALPGKHLGNFLSGKYLPGCRIITSGRNYILGKLGKSVEFKKVVALTGLSKKAIKQIIFDRIDRSKAERFFRRLENELPSLMSLCSSPACLGYTLYVMDTNKGHIKTLSDIMMVFLEEINQQGHENLKTVFTGIRSLSYDGIKKHKVLFNEEDFTKNNLKAEHVIKLSLQCSWGPDFQLIQKRSFYFFTHLSVQESFASLFAASLRFSRFKEFVETEINHTKFWLVRRLLHGILKRNCDEKTRQFIKADRIEDKRNLLYMNDANLLKKLFNMKIPDYHEILEIFYCLYESREIDENIQKEIKTIELKNLPISSGDAHVIGWVISHCSVIKAISFWNCTLDSSVLQTMEKSVDGKGVQVSSFNIHDCTGVDPDGMKAIGNITTHCATEGLVFQQCEIHSRHVIALLESKLQTIDCLIFWSSTKVGEELLAAILKLLPRVSRYLGLDMWDLTEGGKKKIQMRLNELQSSNLKVNIYPRNFLERETAKPPSTDGEPPAKRFKKSTAPIESQRPKKVVAASSLADRKNLRVDAKIERFMDTEGLLGNLELSYLPLTPNNTKKVSDALIAARGATMLKLRSSVQSGTFRMIESYFEKNLEPAQAISIHEVDISSNRNLGEENTSALGKLLCSWKTKSINLSECHCTAQEIEALTVATNQHQISTIRYNNNRMSITVAAAIAKFTIQSSVQELHLVNCNLNYVLLKELEHNADKAKIAVLDLSYNIAMSSEGYEVIGRFVRRSRITTLAFVGCETKFDELQSLQKQMGSANLKSLDLSCNTLLMEGDNGDEVVEILAKIKTLSLKVAGCGLAAHDLQNIEGSLAENQLEHLNIRGNADLGEESIQVLVTLIRKLSLKRVDITNCGWGLKQIETLPDDVKRLIENEDFA